MASKKRAAKPAAPSKAKAKRGAPSLYDKPMKSVLVMLDEESITRARQHGDGNLSKGIRKALAVA